MLTYLPNNLSPRPALVVVLHGSMQSAANYDRGAGWSTLADRYGFALLMPEQSRRNNLNRSFNWFQRNDTQRGARHIRLRKWSSKWCATTTSIVGGSS
jgi:poly(hydroxyalkanoate) depolymerase family esterase